MFAPQQAQRLTNFLKSKTAMAITIDSGSKRCISYDEFSDYLINNIDMRDDESVISAAESLCAFNNNKRFALDLLHRELCLDPLAESSAFVSHHSMIIGRGIPKCGGTGFAIRLNLWPVVGNSQLLQEHKSSVEHTYSYEYPHDHNFMLLTAGFLGPGYQTAIYERELDPEPMVGAPARLKFLERTQLTEGRVIFFRKSKDVHIQMPPTSLSMSLNLLPEQENDGNTEQYYFNVKDNLTQDFITGSRISGRVLLIRTIAELQVGDAVPLLFDIAEGNKVPRVRLEAMRALQLLAPSERNHIALVAARDTDTTVKAAEQELRW